MTGNTVYLIGAGPMSRAYAKVLKAQDRAFQVIGRGQESAAAFEAETGIAVALGGLEGVLHGGYAPDYAIVAVGVADLSATTRVLLDAGVRNILVEKPAGLNLAEIDAVRQKAADCQANVRVAFNRRFFASVRAAERLIAEDGGVSSFTFEFTEWAHKLAGSKHAAPIKRQWFLANSVHVVDLAFYLGGWPKELFAVSSGSLDWHPKASRFSGAGTSEGDVTFSYRADWAAPGRWGVEVLTEKRRFILSPMEQLQVQHLGSIAVEPNGYPEAHMDEEFKPGLYRLVEAFFAGDNSGRLPTIAQAYYNTKHIFNAILPDDITACAQARHMLLEREYAD